MLVLFLKKCVQMLEGKILTATGFHSENIMNLNNRIKWSESITATSLYMYWHKLNTPEENNAVSSPGVYYQVC